MPLMSQREIILQVPNQLTEVVTAMFYRLLQIITVLIVGLGLSISRVEAYEVNCTTPVDATKTLLKNLMGDDWDHTAAAACIRGDEKAAIQLKQVLDAKGIFIDYGNLPSTPDYTNESGRSTVILDPRLNEIELERVEEGPFAGQWQLTEQSKENVHILYSETFSAYVSTLLEFLPEHSSRASLGYSFGNTCYSFIIILSSWLTGRIVDRVIYNRFLAFIDKQTFSLDPSKLVASTNILFGWSSLYCSWLDYLIYSCLFASVVVCFFIARLIMSFSAVIFCSRIIDLLSEIFISKAELTESKLDDQLIPLINRAEKHWYGF